MSPRVLPPAPALRAALALAAAALAGCNAAERTALAPGAPRFTQAAVAPVVNSLDDVVDAEGCTDAHCSLREAVTFAEPGAQISFSVTGTITLTTPANNPYLCGCNLRLEKDLTIRGPGAGRLTVSAGAAGTVFAVSRETFGSLDVTISGLTITGGNTAGPYTGGGIRIGGGTLTLRNVTVSGNSGREGGGIHNGGGTLRLDHSTVSNNTASDRGGGVYSNYGAVTLERSTVSGNTAQSGAGIHGRYAALSLDESTVSGNVAQVAFGGVTNLFGELVIRTSTVSHNSAEPGRASGVNTVGTTVVQKSILADNTGGDCAMLTGDPGPLSGEYNLVETPGNCAFGAGAVTGVDPKLGPLADNGGATWTHALLAGSPAVDAILSGSNGCGIGTDQRGAARPQGAGCDIGAFERTPLTVTSTVDAAGTLAKRTGAATVRGTLTCSEPAAVALQVGVSQPQTKGRTTSTVSGSAAITVNCAGTTAWAAEVTPASGKFVAGAASVTASAAGAPPTTRTVQLN